MPSGDKSHKWNDRPRAERRKFLAMLGVTSAGVLAGCAGGGDDQYGGGSPTDTSGGGGGGNGTDTATEAPTDLGRYVKALSDSFTTIDPATNFDHSNRIHANTYEPLLWFNQNGNDEVNPGLAKSYDVSDDGLVWTFNLRQGVQFHHGYGELTSEDVKFSIERMVDMGRGAAYLWFPVKSIDTPDDYTAKFTLKYQIPLDLIASAPFGSWIYSKEGTQDQGSTHKEQETWFEQGNEVGTGPYKISEWQESDHLTLEKFEDYWGGWDRQHFSEIVWQIVPEPSTRVQMIKGGDAQQVDQVPFSVLSSLEEDENVNLVTSDSFVQLIGQINVKKKPTDDVNVRKAMLHAFPYEQAIEEIRQGYGQPNAIPVPNAMIGHNDDLAPYDHDLDKAKDYIDQSKYSADEIKPTLTYSPAYEEQRRSALTLKSELEKIGVELEAKKFPWTTKWSRAKNLDTAPNVIVYLWWPTYTSPFPNLWDLFHSWEEGTKPLFNLTYWQNKEFDNMLLDGQAKMATDRQAGLEIFKDAQKMVYDNALSYTFWDATRVRPLRAEIKGFQPNYVYPNITFFRQLHK